MPCWALASLKPYRACPQARTRNDATDAGAGSGQGPCLQNPSSLPGRQRIPGYTVQRRVVGCQPQRPPSSCVLRRLNTHRAGILLAELTREHQGVGNGTAGGLCKTRLLARPRVLLPDSYESFPTRLVNARQRLLRPIERRFPHHTFPSRRSRCGSSVCQDWTKSNSANLSSS